MDEWTVAFTYASPISESELIDLQAEFDDDFDVTVAAQPDAGTWTVSVGVDAQDVGEAVRHAGEIAKQVVHDRHRPVGAEAFTSAQLERRAFAPTLPVLVGASEVAALLGVSRQRVHQLREHEGFPVPLVEVAMGLLWDERAVLKFDRDWARRPGRPALTG